IIMIGEIRDRETAEVAIQAALTGHLVLSSLHTNDAPSTLTRLIDIGAQPYLVSATLLGVLAQRLVRTLCPYCKTAADVTRRSGRDWLPRQKPGCQNRYINRVVVMNAGIPAISVVSAYMRPCLLTRR